MKRLGILALMAVLVALPVRAQRVASRGGFSGHAAQPFHGGFNTSAPSRFSGSSRIAPGRSLSGPRGFLDGHAGGFSARPPYTGDRRHRRPYLWPYRSVVPYAFPGWVSPYYLAYPDDSAEDESQTPANYAAEGYGEQSPEQEEAAPRIPYQAAPSLPHPPTAPDSESAVTLVFKDGRPTEQIHNYVLTRTTLYVGDQHHREIPTDQLDLIATAKVNHEAGVDFHLPGADR